MKGILALTEHCCGENFHALYKIIIHGLDNIRGHTGLGLERDKGLVFTLIGFKIKLNR